MKQSLIILLISVAACSAPMVAQGTTSDATQVKIDLSQSYQTITGFGASDCWTAEYVGRYFDDANRENAARCLFSQELDSLGNPLGIGLSNWRVNLGAGSSRQDTLSKIEDGRRVDCFLNDDGTAYDWTRCPGQQYFMQKAKQYGVDHITLFSNSPLIFYTRNGLACNPGQLTDANLKDSCYSRFADYLAQVASHFTALGYPIAAISPVNEPQYVWAGGQEGSPWTNQNIARLTRELDAALTRHNSAVMIQIPEAGDWTQMVNFISTGRAANQVEAFFNPDSSTYVGNLPHVAHTVSGHDYWSYESNLGLTTLRGLVAQEAQKYGLQVAATEFSMLDFANNFPINSKIDQALFMARLIHCDLTYGNMVSWDYWTAFAQERYSQNNRFYLIRVNAKGENGNESYGSLTGGGNVFPDYNLWALGNYSRFIRPGFKRVKLTGATDINNMMASAYLSPDSGQLVVVLVNVGQVARQVQLTLSGSDLQPSTIAKFTTNSRIRLKRDSNLSEVYDSTAVVPIPMRSVVTLVMSLKRTSAVAEVHTDAAAPGYGPVYNLNGTVVAPRLSDIDGLSPGIYISQGRKIIKR